MNITELARILKISPNELREFLPRLGFNIGYKAIKVDMGIARRIIREWPIMMAKLKAERERAAGIISKEDLEADANRVKAASIPKFITVRDFAATLQLPVNKILAELMKNGIFVSMNERIDFDTASIIGADLKVEITPSEEKEQEDIHSSKKLEDALKNEKQEDMNSRCPVVVVMGHVDHGKTKLLDSIRTTNVVAGEAGGITQHIGAYQVVKGGKTITFIDTPGHEAFTAMRSRGAKVADIAILVVAADDGVKPQTIEAFRIIEAAKIPYIVAINKIDKPEADVNRTKQELASVLNITSEDWGGKAICVPVSAKDGVGIPELLEMILLIADTEADNLRANPEAGAIGTVVEAKIDKSAGPVATILVQNGTLRVGDQLCFNGIIYGKVRSLKNYKGEDIESAGPSCPAKILGLKALPTVGDLLEVGEGEKLRFNKIVSHKSNEQTITNNTEEDHSGIAKINVIIKSDVLGSGEAIEESLLKLSNEKIKVKILYKGLGNIGDNDVKRAEDSDAIILGFNTKINPQIEPMLREKKIKIQIFSIIYDLIKYVKTEIQTLIKPDIIRTDLGKIKVLEVFRSQNNFQIIGGAVIDGIAEKDALVDVYRGKELMGKGNIEELQAGKQNVKSVEAGSECGMKYVSKTPVEKGDELVVYKEAEVIAKL